MHERNSKLANKRNYQKELDSLQEKIQEIDIVNCEFNPDFSKNIKEIEKILSYYKKRERIYHMLV